MNGPAPRFAVAVVGFSEIERKVLHGIFRLSDQRPVRYSGADTGASRPPDIFLVDGDDELAVAQWRATNSNGQVVTVIAGQMPVAGLPPSLSRPLQWARLLKALDAVVAKARIIPGGLAAAAAILVVDNAPSVRIFLKQKFEPLGCTVDFSDDGDAALAMMQGTRYLLVFLDAAADGSDSYQLCKQMKAAREESSSARVIMLTHPDTPFNKLRGAMSGCDGNLAKPIDEARLDALINRYFPHLLRIEAPLPTTLAG
jgi:twitching motility two-component system response regulator PilG